MPDSGRRSPGYREDFYAWALQQAAFLREVQDWRPTVALDIDNLVEEVEGLARSERAAARSQVRRIIVHLLKLQISPARDPRGGWVETVGDARLELEEHLTPTLEAETRQDLSTIYEKARRQAVRALEQQGEKEAAKALPSLCPYSWEEVRGEDWYPDPPARKPRKR